MDRELTPKERNSARRRKYLPYIIGGTALAAGLITLLIASRQSVDREDLLITTVDSGTIETSVTGSGSIVPAFEEIINSPINSRIIEVYCKAGDSVDIGTPLLRLDLQSTETELNKLKDQIQMKNYELEQQKVNNNTRVSDLAMQVKVKEMTVNRLEAELRNECYLDSLGSGTGDRVRQAKLAYSTGKLELEQMRQQLANERKVTDAGLSVKNLDINIARKNLGEMSRTLDDAQIKAPRKATLTFINDQIGQKVSEGEKIAIISDLSHFKVDGEIADAYGDRIRVGSKAVVRIGRNERMDGIVSNVTPLSRNGVISFSVRLDDDADRRLRSGLKTDVYIMCNVMEDVRRIKNGSFYTGPGSYELFVFNGDDKLERRSVRLGDSNFEFVEVVDGLNDGDRVVVSDMKRFINATSVKVK
ncbi:efflux RND transporter periplasmic adaptor subunit [Duncaniella muris]|uniref:HlyD family secretion protein n=1 Tax=Duncaniella muris TaxID=2094150 RepID=A0A2V1IPA3_9BACT|nr:HlyD family efflux transporter periplasmic adaptor subunit [Duncaniella muris]NBH92890.1 HlyD family efflux transporter periplasmic adaptor subunit [Muribaculaceae bacterium S4]NBI21313.1 HlyD family efflux transporter periplasmic adaptor subunit [Muribaculaceae bacterium Z1]PWB02818.1 HlyD family secretion protein [Duncaniella muris]